MKEAIYTYFSSADNLPYRRTHISLPNGGATGAFERAYSDGTFKQYKGDSWRITEQSSVISKNEFDKLVKQSA